MAIKCDVAAYTFLKKEIIKSKFSDILCTGPGFTRARLEKEELRPNSYDSVP